MRLQRVSVTGRDWFVVQIHRGLGPNYKATIVACYDNEHEAREHERPNEGLIACLYDPQPCEHLEGKQP